MIQSKNLMVSVSMITYKHEAYIQQAIEGVLMQETNFEFDLIIADDCSPDKTSEIVKEFINNHPKAYRIKYFRHEENIGMQSNGNFATSQCDGKYIAICEGDDYWTDHLKLQKQIDFLEINPDFALSHSNFFRYIQNSQKKVNNAIQFPANKVFYGLIKGQYPIGTLTVVFRKQILDDYFRDINPENKGWLMGDLPFWLYLSRFHKVHYIDEISAAYRVLEESASNTRQIDKMIRFDKSVLEIKLFFIEKYGYDCINKELIKREIEAVFVYRKIIAFAICKGNLKAFFSLLIQFYKINTKPRYFLGTFKQILIRFS